MTRSSNQTVSILKSKRTGSPATTSENIQKEAAASLPTPRVSSKTSQSTLSTQNTVTDYDDLTQCFQVITRHYRAGEEICCYSAMEKEIAVLKSGSADIVRIEINGNLTILDHLIPGDAFGKEIAFSTPPSDSISVVTNKTAEVIFIPMICKEKCDHNQPCHQILTRHLFSLISRKTSALSKRIEVLSCKTIQEKLLRYFTILSFEQGNNPLTLPFSYGDLSNYICADRSAMMRELKKLRDAKAIITEGRNITIRN